jgi:hypothetical protein
VGCGVITSSAPEWEGSTALVVTWAPRPHNARINGPFLWLYMKPGRDEKWKKKKKTVDWLQREKMKIYWNSVNILPTATIMIIYETNLPESMLFSFLSTLIDFSSFNPRFFFIFKFNICFFFLWQFFVKLSRRKFGRFKTLRSYCAHIAISPRKHGIGIK